MFRFASLRLTGCLLAILLVVLEVSRADGTEDHCNTHIIETTTENNTLVYTFTCDYHSPCPGTDPTCLKKTFLFGDGTTMGWCECADGTTTPCCHSVWIEIPGPPKVTGFALMGECQNTMPECRPGVCQEHFLPIGGGGSQRKFEAECMVEL